MRKFTESLIAGGLCIGATTAAYGIDARMGDNRLEQQIECIKDIEDTEAANTFTMSRVCVDTIQEHKDYADNFDLAKLGGVVATIYFGRRAYKDRKYELELDSKVGQMYLDAAQQACQIDDGKMTIDQESVTIIYPEA